jgi:RNA polymerase sigma-70 factor (ECF subfamily)
MDPTSTEAQGPTDTKGAAASLEPSDRDLVALARNGDTSAFTTLVGRHQRQIYRLALRMMGSESEAEEVLQETFLHAYEKLGEFRGDSAFNSWIYRIAANSALMRLRRKRRAPDTVSLDGSSGTAPAEGQPGPNFTLDGNFAEPPRSDWSLRADDALANAQLGAAIERAVQGLPEDYRVVFLLKDVDGLSNEEISESLGLSVPAVKSRLHRARLALREQLSEFFGKK